MLKYSVTPSLLFITLFTLAGYAFAGPHAYVPNEKDGNVSVIDTEIDKVIGKLPAKGRLGKKFKQQRLIQQVKSFTWWYAMRMLLRKLM